MVHHSLLEKKETMDKQQSLSKRMISTEKIYSDRYDIIAYNPVLTPSNGISKHYANNASLSNLNVSDIGFKAEITNILHNNRTNSNVVQINQYLKQYIAGNTPTNTKNKFFTNSQSDINNKINVKNLSPNTMSKSNTQMPSANNYYINNKNRLYNINLKDNDQNNPSLTHQRSSSTNFIIDNNNEGDITTVEKSDDNKLKTNKTSLNETTPLTNSNSTYNMQTTDSKVSKRYDTGRANLNNNVYANNKKESSNNIDIEIMQNLVCNFKKLFIN